MAALAVMVLGMVSAQASAADLSLSLNLAQGKVNVALHEDNHHHVVHKKEVKHKKNVKHMDRCHEMKKHDKDRRHFVAHKDNRKKGNRR